MKYLLRTRMARFTVDWAFVAIISTWRWAEMLLVGMRARTRSWHNQSPKQVPLPHEWQRVGTRQSASRHVRSIAKLLVRESSQVLFFSNPLVSLFSKHGQILFKLTHCRIDHIFCTIWFFTTWVDCERSGADGRTAELLGILTELALFPLLPLWHQMSKVYVPWTDTCSNLTWPQAEPGSELLSPKSDIKPHSLYHQSHWIREPIPEGWQVH